MLTVRPLNENGTWQHKTEKEYLCVKDGEERGFTAAEYKAAQYYEIEESIPVEDWTAIRDERKLTVDEKRSLRQRLQERQDRAHDHRQKKEHGREIGAR